MPLITETSVNNGHPAQVSVTVRETVGPGGGAASLDVYMTIDTDYATLGTGHTPGGFRVSSPPATVCWLKQSLPAGDKQVRFTINLTPAFQSDVSVCTAVYCVVQGTYDGGPYFETRTPIVCFP